MTSQTTFQPTFFLKKVDPIKIINTYHTTNHFQHINPLTWFNQPKITLEAPIIPSITGISKSFRDKNNSIVIIHTTNNELIKKLPSYNPRCFWCMQDLPSQHDLHVPIPTNITYADNCIYVETDSGGQGGGSCCSFECALAYIRNFKHNKGNGRSYKEETLEIYLKAVYKWCYPNKTDLLPAPDFRLLQSSGGTMTFDEFIHSKSSFILMPTINIQSISNQFMNYHTNNNTLK
jgi:hypothetical protein